MKNIKHTGFVNCLSLSALLLSASISSSAILFSTFEDFSGWTSIGENHDAIPTQSNADLDGGLTNGLSNSNPGGLGTPGSLLINTGSGTNYFDLIQGPNQAGNAAFINALTSNNTLTLDYTNPIGRTNTAGDTYFDVSFLVNYGGGSTSLLDIIYGTTENMGTFNRTTVDFTAVSAKIRNQQNNGGGIDYLFLGINGFGEQRNSTFNVDKIQAVPEPSTYVMFGIGGLILFAFNCLRKRVCIKSFN